MQLNDPMYAFASLWMTCDSIDTALCYFIKHSHSIVYSYSVLLACEPLKF